MERMLGWGFSLFNSLATSRHRLGSPAILRQPGLCDGQLLPGLSARHSLLFRQTDLLLTIHNFYSTLLTTLDLSRNEFIGEIGAQALSELRNLTTLLLRQAQLGDGGAKALGSLTNLRTLVLANNNLGDAGAQALSGLTNLTTLDLAKNNLGDMGAKALGSLTNLTMLVLSKTEVSDLSPFKILFEKGIPPKWETGEIWEEGIYVGDCPLIHPPPEVVKQGLESVLNYFREIEVQG